MIDTMTGREAKCWVVGCKRVATEMYDVPLTLRREGQQLPICDGHRSLWFYKGVLYEREEAE